MKLSSETQRMIFGFMLLIILATLTARVALGHVEEATSYGLMPLITCLATLAGAFAQWAFSAKPVDKPEDDKKPTVTPPEK